MKRDPVREGLEALAAAARRPHTDESVALIRASLGHRSNLVVARAARAAREAGLSSLTPDLIAAFPRWLEDPIKRDPGCGAKTEIVRALLAFEYPAPGVYLAGVAHVQREPAFGPPIDTAAELRAASAMALVVTEHPAGLASAVDLLVDPERAARAGGLRALMASGRPDVALLMRLFALRGDPDPGVIAEAFAGLLALATDDPVSFVAARMAAADVDVARGAAMALGDARRSEAVAALRDHLAREPRPDVRHAVIVALATSRDEEAVRALLELVTRGPAFDSTAAANALGLYEHDGELQRRVQAALAARVEPTPAAPLRSRRRQGADGRRR